MVKKPEKAKKLTPKQLAKEEELKRKEAEREQRLLDKQQLQRNENSIRMAVLKDVYKGIEAMYRKMARTFAHDDKIKNWERYVTCENLPSGKSPAELRDFLYKWKVDSEQKLKKLFDWMLNIDERSLLDQNLARIDRSERYLRSCQADLAPPFFDKIRDSLVILDKVNDVLQNASSLKITPEDLDDIKTTREEYQSYILNYLDQMTHLITGNINREMESLNPIDATFMAKSDTMSIGIFTHKNVPLPPITADSEPIQICLDSVKTTIDCPSNLSFDGHSIRVCWFNFDHYSDLAPSHNIPFDDEHDINQNLLQSCRFEWETREDWSQKELLRMKSERAEFDANVLAMEALKQNPPKGAKAAKGGKAAKGAKEPKEPKAKKGKKGAKGAKGKAKVKEPPVVTERTVIDMTDAFRIANDKEHNDRMEKLKPEVGLNLKPFELNQRQYKVLGGTYSVHYLKRPAQFKTFVNHIFQRTYLLPNDTQYNPFSVKYAPITLRSDISITAAEKEAILNTETEQFGQLLDLTVDLPPGVCWWDEPEIVRWQIWEESDEFLALREELRHYNLNFKKIELAKSMMLFNRIIKRQNNIETVADFDLDLRSEDISLYYVMTKFIVPKLSLTYRFECEMHEEEEKLARELKRREHIRREQEEDLRLRREEEERIKEARKRREAEKLLQAQLREEQAKQREEEARQRAREAPLPVEPEEQSELPEEPGAEGDGDAASVRSAAVETAVASAVASPSESTMDLESAEIPDEPVFAVMKRIVQGKAAQELFPSGGEGASPVITEDKNETSIDSTMLSQLMHAIDEYNESELPVFTGVLVEPSPQEDSDTSVDAVSVMKTKKKAGKPTKKSTKDDFFEFVGVPEKDSKVHLVQHHKGKWTSEGIYLQKYDSEAKRIKFKVGKIGIFGFAQNQYVHFPLQSWELRPNTDEVPMSVRFLVVGTHISLNILITSGGYLLTVERPRPKICPVKVPETTMDLKSLIHYLKTTNMNIFPSHDAYWYMPVEHGYPTVSYKHEPMANHTYQAMAYYCQTHQFKWSPWNRLATRREAVFESRQIVDGRTPDAFAELKITPYDACFVRVTEECTPIEVVQLDYKLDPPEPEFSCDMFELLSNQSIDKSKKKQVNTNGHLKYNVAEFLKAVQPLSYS